MGVMLFRRGWLMLLLFFFLLFWWVEFEFEIVLSLRGGA